MSKNASIQYDSSGKLQHFLSVKDLKPEDINEILKTAAGFFNNDGTISTHKTACENKIIANLFFEPSTRTRISFEIATYNLGAHTIHFNPDVSSATKGESLLDTVNNLIAMGVSAFVVREKAEHTATLLAEEVKNKAHIINAGDGRNEHPTQAMLDLLTIQQYKHNFSNLSVAIVGDILHSRVAHSLTWALHRMGTPDIRWVSPVNLLPSEPPISGIKCFNQLKSGLENVDVIVALRLQKERMIEASAINAAKYFAEFGISTTALKYAKPDAIIMHPGPINRNIEIASDVADGKQSVILKQVTNGIATRMAIIKKLLVK